MLIRVWIYRDGLDGEGGRWMRGVVIHVALMRVDVRKLMGGSEARTQARKLMDGNEVVYNEDEVEGLRSERGRMVRVQSCARCCWRMEFQGRIRISSSVVGFSSAGENARRRSLGHTFAARRC